MSGNTTPKPIQASAPGKVLILGGYVIVEEHNVGLSVGVNARFTTRLESQKKIDTNSVVVNVTSPQFHQNYSFEVRLEDKGGDERALISQTIGPSSVFLKYAILYTVAAHFKPGKEINLVLLADNDFYTQKNYLDERGLTVSAHNLRNLPPHLPLQGEISKTGLGSSAAMTTSLVACLCRVLQDSLPDLDHVHGLAQIAHSVAQKKVGSGFDVYTAVFGTCAYRRFSPEGVSAMLKGEADPSTVNPSLLQRSVQVVCSSAQHTAFQLPNGFRLLLGDIHHGGSSTPGMVVKIMAWQKSLAGTPGNLWESLKASNESYIKQLHQLSQLYTDKREEYLRAFNRLEALSLAKVDDNATPEEALFLEAFRCAYSCRTKLRQVGIEAGVPVEPTELTGLLDETAQLPGVFATGCPGAGGYDAVFAIVLGDQAAERVEAFWESKDVCPLLVREDPCGLKFEGEL